MQVYTTTSSSLMMTTMMMVMTMVEVKSVDNAGAHLPLISAPRRQSGGWGWGVSEFVHGLVYRVWTARTVQTKSVSNKTKVIF